MPTGGPTATAGASASSASRCWGSSRPCTGCGVLANLGIGSGSLSTSNPSLPTANGTQSFAGVGLFHEWGFAYGHDGHFAFGPALEFDAIWSQPFEQHGLVASARLAYYGGP